MHYEENYSGTPFFKLRGVCPEYFLIILLKKAEEEKFSCSQIFSKVYPLCKSSIALAILSEFLYSIGETVIIVEKTWCKFENGQIKVRIYKTFPIEQSDDAQQVLYRGENVGKVVLIVKE